MKNIRKWNTRRELGEYSSFRRQFNYCSWWDGNLTLHLHAGETILIVIAIPHVSSPSRNTQQRIFIIYYNSSTLPVRVTLLLSPDQCHVQTRTDEALMSAENRDRNGIAGEWYLYKRICQIGFLRVRAEEAANTHALHPDAINEDHLLSKSPGTRMRTFNTPEGQGEFKGSDDESCSGKRARTCTLTYQQPFCRCCRRNWQNLRKWVRSWTWAERL